MFSNDLKTEFNSAQVLVVVPSLHNPFFYNLFVLAITYAHQNSMKVRVTYLNNHKESCSNCKELTSARDNFKRFLLKLEIETIEVKYQSKIESFPLLKFWINPGKTLRNFPDEKMNSILSYFKTQKLQSDALTQIPRRYFRKVMQLAGEFEFSYGVLSAIFATREVQNVSEQLTNLVITLNGRYPIQAGIRYFCHGQAIKFYSLEHGQRHQVNMHLADFQPHEIRRLDSWISQSLASYSHRKLLEISNFGKSWLNNQENSRVTNPFLPDETKRRHVLAQFPIVRDKGTRLLICTSSIDERFSNLGLDSNGWDNSVAAYNSVIQKAILSSLNVTVKIHPNSLNKSWKDLWILYRSIKRSEDLSIINPWEEISSIDLIESHEYFVTWGSSLMISAAAREKKGFLLGPVVFMSTLGIKPLSPIDLQKLSFENLPHLDSKRALLAAGIIRNWGYPIVKLRNQLPIAWEWLEGNAVNGAANPLQTFIIRIRRRVKYMSNISKGRYITPNETVDVLTKVFFIPENAARKFVKSCFFGLLHLRENFTYKYQYTSTKGMKGV